MRNDASVILKALEPVRQSKFHKEIKILQILSGGPNMIRLLDVLPDPRTDAPEPRLELKPEHVTDEPNPVLVMEYIDNGGESLRNLAKSFTDYELRYYMFELLKALDFAHSKGIMHRDVKPGNIMVDPIKRELKLIDWGLADFYLPHKEYNVRVSTLKYKGPELLVNVTRYDYSLDIWSTGTSFAGFLFHKSKFFKGDSNDDMLVQFAKVLGTQGLYDYASKYDVPLSNKYKTLLGKKSRQPWDNFINSRN